MSSRLRLSSSAALVVVALVAGCHDDPVCSDCGTRIRAFTTTPTSAEMRVGDSLLARVDAVGLGHLSVRWRSARPDVVRIDTIVAAGEPVVLRATGVGQAAIDFSVISGTLTVDGAIPATVTARPVELVATPPRDSAAAFQTDSLDYTLRATGIAHQGSIGVTFTNRSADTAYIVNCNGQTNLWLEKLVDGAWQRVWVPGVQACLSPPIVVAPRASYRTGIFVFGGYPENNVHPKFGITAIDGVYRAVWTYVLSSYQTSLPFGAPFPLEARTSNRFALRTEPR